MTKAVEAILASPQFLFRLEDTPATARPGQPYRLADVELASRLSYFVWGAAPDAPLLALAAEGKLAAPGALEKQARQKAYQLAKGVVADVLSLFTVANFGAAVFTGAPAALSSCSEV